MGEKIFDEPADYQNILAATRESGFSMASDPQTCLLLRTLSARRKNGKFLELGTGTGLSTCWILDGMGAEGSLLSVDNDLVFLQVAEEFLGHDIRLQLVKADGGDWLIEHSTAEFDFIFADTWHGKYLMLDETLQMLKTGGLYIIDDMLPQPNWPDGHAEKVAALISILEKRKDLWITKLDWSTGIVVASKK